MTYGQALAEATITAMRQQKRVHLFGVGVTDPTGIFGTTLQAAGCYPERVHETPISEAAVTGVAIGMALEGCPAIVVHARADFLLLTLDQLVNHAACWPWMTGQPVPLVIRAIVGKGFGQGPQHAKPLHGLLTQIPGLRVLMPATVEEARTTLGLALDGERPTIILEDRSLWTSTAEASHERRASRQARVTIVGLGRLRLLKVPHAEHVGLWDLSDVEGWRARVLASVWRTGRLIVADPGWPVGGLGAEVIASVAERIRLKARPVRISLPWEFPPSSPAEEARYYDQAEQLQRAARRRSSVSGTTTIR